MIRAILAPTLPKVVGARTRATIAEDVVDAAHGAARVDSVQAPVQFLDAGGVRLRVEVPCQDDGIVLVRVLCDDLHDVVRGCSASAATILTHGQGPVVVDEEQVLVALRVVQTNPLHAALAVVLLARILADILIALCHQPEAIRAVHHRNRPASIQSLPRTWEALLPGVSQHSPDVVTLLESH